MTTYHRVTVVKNTSKNTSKRELFLSRGKWTVPEGYFQRQDRFQVPETVYEKYLKVDTENVKEFAFQWAKYDNPSIWIESAREKNMTNTNNAFTKLVEPGYSIFAELHVNSTETVPKFVADLSASGLNDFNVTAAQFIEDPVSHNYHNSLAETSEKLPQGLYDMALKIACPEDTEQCIETYKKMLDRVSSISLEFNNLNSPNRLFAAEKEVILTMYWNAGALKDLYTEHYKSDVIKREIGVFAVDGRASQVNDLSVIGITAELPSNLIPKDENDKELTGEALEKALLNDDDIKVAQKSMFFIKPRHIYVSEKDQMSINSSFAEPYGLHPVHRVSVKDDGLTLKRNISSGKISAEPPMNKQIFDCELFAHYNLPNSVFLDKNEFTNDHSGDLDLLGVWGETDLESPSYNTEKWGSKALLRVNVETRTADDTFDYSENLAKLPQYSTLYELQMHSRYQKPGKKLADASVPKPDVFWACELNKTRLYDLVNNKKMKKSDMKNIETSFDDKLIFKNPMDLKSNLNLEGLFTNNTVFYHYNYEVADAYGLSNADFQDRFTIPAADSSSYLQVQLFTVAAILISLVIFGKTFAEKLVSKILVSQGKSKLKSLGKDAAKDAAKEFLS